MLKKKPNNNLCLTKCLKNLPKKKEYFTTCLERPNNKLCLTNAFTMHESTKR
jgi:hypothetical protein